MNEFARRRLEKASESIEAARLLLDEGFEDSAADRSYRVRVPPMGSTWKEQRMRRVSAH